MHLFTNGFIFFSKETAWAKELLTDDNGTIVAISKTEHGLKHSERDAEIVDLKGGYLFPAFEDAHNHPAMMCRLFSDLNINGVQSWTEAQAAIRSYIAAHPRKEWYSVYGWNNATWGDLKDTDIDPLTEKPLFIMNISFHGGVLNTAAQRKLREDRVEVAHDHGVVEEEQFQIVEALTLPKYDELLSLIPQFERELHTQGIVSVHDMWIATMDQLEAYMDLDRTGKLSLNVAGHISSDLLNHPKIHAALAHTGPHFSVAGIKIFLDGAIGVHTAFMSNPYKDVRHRGIPRGSFPDVATKIAKAYHAGLRSFAIHAIGDAAISTVLTICEKLSRKYTDASWRIEHSEVIHPRDIQRMVHLPITLVMQPNFSWDIGNYKDRLGDMVRWINPFRLLLNGNVAVAFGSDNMPTNPFQGIAWALEYGAYPEQKITRKGAMALYTAGGAKLAQEKKTRGSIDVGKKANLMLLDQNPFDETVSLERIRVLETWFEGKPQLSSRVMERHPAHAQHIA